MIILLNLKWKYNSGVKTLMTSNKTGYLLIVALLELVPEITGEFECNEQEGEEGYCCNKIRMSPLKINIVKVSN